LSFCCGASMIGSVGTLQHINVYIHHVPIVFCPVCNDMEVHYQAIKEYEILVEYAQEDGAAELDFRHFTMRDPYEQLFENCVNDDGEDPLEIICTQIDMALDLWSVAKKMKDLEWQKQLINRLSALSHRRDRQSRKHLTDHAV